MRRHVTLALAAAVALGVASQAQAAIMMKHYQIARLYLDPTRS